MPGNRAALDAVMPTMRAHAGVWEGVYRHLDADAVPVDTHRVRIACRFPDDGPHAYVQHNLFVWDDGREARSTLPGTLRGDRLWWDTPTFHGSAWETHDGILMLNLTRKDEPGASFFETIVMGAGGAHRARTWQWFRDGRLYRRTLCDEQRVGPEPDAGP